MFIKYLHGTQPQLAQVITGYTFSLTLCGVVKGSDQVQDTGYHTFHHNNPNFTLLHSDTVTYINCYLKSSIYSEIPIYLFPGGIVLILNECFH